MYKVFRGDITVAGSALIELHSTGALLGRDRDGGISFIFAPGTWDAVVWEDE